MADEAPKAEPKAKTTRVKPAAAPAVVTPTKPVIIREDF